MTPTLAEIRADGFLIAIVLSADGRATCRECGMRGYPCRHIAAYHRSATVGHSMIIRDSRGSMLVTLRASEADMTPAMRDACALAIDLLPNGTERAIHEASTKILLFAEQHGGTSLRPEPKTGPRKPLKTRRIRVIDIDPA